jgi:predicted  nucleic acid-binding Zn-ribbon protein
VTTEKKTGFLGLLANVGNAFVEHIPDAPPSAQPRPAPQPAGYRTPSYPAHAPAQTEADPEVLEKLEHRLQTNCPPMYTAFMEQYAALQMIPDEGMRFHAALAASHSTTDQLVGAIDQLMQVMDTTRTDFEHTHEAMTAKKLGDAQSALKSTDDQVASYEKQLQSIQETIAALRQKREADAQAIQHETERLEGIHASFEAAHAQVMGKLAAQKNRVQAMPKVG